jgi:hypothetical protein
MKQPVSSPTPAGIMTPADAEACTGAYYPFNDARFYMILGCGMGPGWAADAFQTVWQQEEAHFDYVRIYQPVPQRSLLSDTEEALPEYFDAFPPEVPRDVLSITGRGFVVGQTRVTLTPANGGNTTVSCEVVVLRRAAIQGTELLAFLPTDNTILPDGNYTVTVSNKEIVQNLVEIQLNP